MKQYFIFRYPAVNQPAWLMSCFCVLMFALNMAGLSGCMQNANQNQQQAIVSPIQVVVKQVDIYRKLGNKVSDGKFLVLTLQFQNLTTTAVTLTPGDVQLETVDSKPENHFVLPVESNLTFDFSSVYGRENFDRLVAITPIVLNPKMDLIRYAIYTVSDSGQLSDYQILIKKYNVKVPLNQGSVVLNDYRQEKRP